MLRIAVGFIWLAVGVACASPSAKAPVVNGNVRAVSNADVDDAVAEVRRCINLEQKILGRGRTEFYVGIYRVRVIDHNTIWIYRHTSQSGTPTCVIMRRVEGKWQPTMVRVGFVCTPNQALERTADRHANLLSMTSTLKPEAQLAVVSGRSACSR